MPPERADSAAIDAALALEVVSASRLDSSGFVAEQATRVGFRYIDMSETFPARLADAEQFLVHATEPPTRACEPA